MLRRTVLLVLTCAFALANPAMAQETAASRRVAIEMIYPIMVKALEAGRFGQARNICDQAILWEPENSVHAYNLACIESRTGEARRDAAFAALERAAKLGFDDLDALAQDPDLTRIRRDLRFAPILEQVARNARRTLTPEASNSEVSAAERQALARSPLAAPLVQPGLARPIDLSALVNVAPPAPASFSRGLPVGLFLMSRTWAQTKTEEKLTWYFAPDGTVYQNLEHGFAPADLTAHPGPKGTCRLIGKILEITWSDHRKSSGIIQRSRTGFAWDRGTFVPALPLPAGMSLSGAYEGGETLSFSRNRAPLARTLELRDDGTFLWRGVSLQSRISHPDRIDAASNGFDTTGRWQANGYALALVDSEGRIFRRIAFLSEAPSPASPARIIFAGTVYSRK
jgi:hypothetical protein